MRFLQKFEGNFSKYFISIFGGHFLLLTVFYPNAASASIVSDVCLGALNDFCDFQLVSNCYRWVEKICVSFFAI